MGSRAKRGTPAAALLELDGVPLQQVTLGSCFLQQEQHLPAAAPLPLSADELALLDELERDELADRHPSGASLQARTGRRLHQRARAGSGNTGNAEARVPHAARASGAAASAGTGASQAGLNAAAMLSAEDCLAFFNPTTEAAFRGTLNTWGARTARLLQLVHEQVLADRGIRVTPAAAGRAGAG